ncbi:MAG: hypothetical protein M1822_000661 [Bathelium mastoideum]|nr:MAG: hypothetical protein M1822_000661 [Bathelium mastoideum]
MPNLEDSSTQFDGRHGMPSDKLDEANKSRLLRVFDYDYANSLRPTIRASPRLRSRLKDHQLAALAMMLEKERGFLHNPTFPSLWNVKLNPGVSPKYRHVVTGSLEASPTPLYGGILADEMGLGKTLSALALICSSIDMQVDQDGPSSGDTALGTLIVAPKTTIPGWQRQIERHIFADQVRVLVYHGSARQSMLPALKHYDVVLTTYETLRMEWVTQGALYSGKWSRLTLDEAHHIRNRSSQAFKAACAINAQYRWCLTGTPIQNSIDDYGALLSFLGVPYLTERSMFDYWIATPLKKGQIGSLERLKGLIRATCLRRTKNIIGNLLELPQRSEKTVMVDFHRADGELYAFFKKHTAEVASGISSRNTESSTRDFFQDSNVLSLLNFLRLICNHGKNLLPSSALAAWETKDRASVDWHLMYNVTDRCRICDTVIEQADLCGDTSHSQDEQPTCAQCLSRHQYSPTENGMRHSDYASEDGTTVNSSSPSPVATPDRPSAKVEALLENLCIEQAQNHLGNSETIIKSVIFSYWTKMLDLIQRALKSKGFYLQRIDGKSSLEERSEAMRQFTEDPKCTVMLASIGSAGEGIDLTAASYVHLIEPHWNPMVEAQTVDRVHRIGQTRNVFVTRYIMRDSIETYIQWVQQDKLKLINRSLDAESDSQPRVDAERWKRLRQSLE